MKFESFSIIHISDLHKSRDYDYNLLFDSLKTDINSYSSEGIPPARFIVVSGDLIQGSKDNNIEIACQEIINQYSEVGEFLDNLVTEFLDGDKNRIIIVPGNHDVNRSVSINSMTSIKDEDNEDVKKSYLSMGKNNKCIYRWDWGKLCFMQISNETLFNKRFDEFARFYNWFYSGIGRKFPDNKEDAYFVASEDKYNIAFACFNSCCNLDHLNTKGLINPSSILPITQAMKLANEKGKLVIGVWHHNIYGSPYSNDYLDRDIVDQLRRNYVKVGLFGHQHKSEMIEELKDIMSNNPEDKMLLVSSGTLFGDKSNMLPGTKRQYNIISIEMYNGKAELSIRLKEDITNDSLYPHWKTKILPNGKDLIKYSLNLNKISDDDRIVSIDSRTRETGDFLKGFNDLKEYRDKENINAQRMSEAYLKEMCEHCDNNDIIQAIGSPKTGIEYACLLLAYYNTSKFNDCKNLLLDTRFHQSEDTFVNNVIIEVTNKINKKSWHK